MSFRNEIIPLIENPGWEKGYLSVHVKVRAMISNDVARMLEIEEVKQKIESFAEETTRTSVDVELMVAAGLDSSTGFSHYDQAGILGKDDSLLTEHLMSLKLVANEQDWWINPNPQSDMFCHAFSMSWVKETDTVTKNAYDKFAKEVQHINEDPILVHFGTLELRVKVSFIYSLIDGKAANAIVGNGNTKACPLYGCFKGSSSLIGPHFYHSKLNWFEWLIRVCTQKQVGGNLPQSHKLVVAMIRTISDGVEDCFKINVNRPQPGGKGSSNHGNTVRKALTDIEKLAKILGMNQDLLENLKMISCLALSSKVLNASKVGQLYATIEGEIEEEFPNVKNLPPCIHKYSHLPELIRSLVSIPNCCAILEFI